MLIFYHLRGLLGKLYSVFTKPTQYVFQCFVMGWILCPGRKVITAIMRLGDYQGRKSHDRFHGFFSGTVWCLGKFFRTWASAVVSICAKNGDLITCGDDTVHKKTGRKVSGAKVCRDAVRSTKSHVVHVWGLQIVLLCLVFRPPWGGETLAIPINMRLYRKRDNDEGPTILDLMREMLKDLVEWFPDRKIIFIADGFYAPMAGDEIPRVELISRLRADAAIYELPPKRKPHQRGASRKKGARLPTPQDIAKSLSPKDWKMVDTYERGEVRKRLVYSRPVLWYKVRREKPILLVISRDPLGVERDDFFFTTNLSMDPGMLISFFADRWGIEDTFRNAKQFLGIEDPQTWKEPGPEKVAGFGYFLYGLVWLSYINRENHDPLPQTPWYQTKAMPSFQDAMAEIRIRIWSQRFMQSVHDDQDLQKFNGMLMETLARAA